MFTFCIFDHCVIAILIAWGAAVFDVRMLTIDSIPQGGIQGRMLELGGSSASFAIAAQGKP